GGEEIMPTLEIWNWDEISWDAQDAREGGLNTDSESNFLFAEAGISPYLNTFNPGVGKILIRVLGENGGDYPLLVSTDYVRAQIVYEDNTVEQLDTDGDGEGDQCDDCPGGEECEGLGTNTIGVGGADVSLGDSSLVV